MVVIPSHAASNDDGFKLHPALLGMSKQTASEQLLKTELPRSLVHSTHFSLDFSVAITGPNIGQDTACQEESLLYNMKWLYS